MLHIHDIHESVAYQEAMEEGIAIARLAAKGKSVEEIAATLGVSPYTLRTHVQNILTKLGVHSKLEALAFAIRHGKVAAQGE